MDYDDYRELKQDLKFSSLADLVEQLGPVDYGLEEVNQIFTTQMYVGLSNDELNVRNAVLQGLD